jgi:hypothetical protein
VLTGFRRKLEFYRAFLAPFGNDFAFTVSFPVDECIARLERMPSDKREIFYPLRVQMLSADNGVYVFSLRKELTLNRFFYVQVVGDLQQHDAQSTSVEGRTDSGILSYFFLAGCVVQLAAVLMLSFQWVLFPLGITLLFWLICVFERNRLAQMLYDALVYGRQ